MDQNQQRVRCHRDLGYEVFGINLPGCGDTARTRRTPPPVSSSPRSPSSSDYSCRIFLCNGLIQNSINRRAVKYDDELGVRHRNIRAASAFIPTRPYSTPALTPLVCRRGG